MSEETKSSTAVKGNARRFLYIANPGSDESSGEEDHQQSQSEGTSQSYNYQPPPLPSPKREPRPLPKLTPLPRLAPSPLTTNLPPDPGRYRSSPSNPNLSSPSSTSSHAIESTPPPSTPGLGGPAVDLPGDVPMRQEPMIGANASDRGDGTQVTIRQPNIFDKIKAVLPHHRQSHSSKVSGNVYPDIVRCNALLYLISHSSHFDKVAHRNHSRLTLYTD